MGKPLHDIKNATTEILRDGPDGVQKVMDDTAKGIGKKMWRAALQVACSGFGKGLLVTAALVIAASALTSGIGAMAAGVALETGLGQGAVAGLSGLLFSGAGLLTLGVGGTLGAVIEVRARQNQITADVAKAEANVYETLRQQQKATQVLKEKEKITGVPSQGGDMPEAGFAAREMQRRNAAQAQPVIGK